MSQVRVNKYTTVSIQNTEKSILASRFQKDNFRQFFDTLRNIVFSANTIHV